MPVAFENQPLPVSYIKLWCCFHASKILQDCIQKTPGGYRAFFIHQENGELLARCDNDSSGRFLCISFLGSCGGTFGRSCGT